MCNRWAPNNISAHWAGIRACASLIGWAGLLHPRGAKQTAASQKRSMAKYPGLLDDRQLCSELRKLGFEAGPITDTTRPVYLKTLKKLRSRNANSVDSGPLSRRPSQIPSSTGQHQALNTPPTSPLATETPPLTPVVSRDTTLAPPTLPSVVSQLLVSLDNGGHLACDTAFLFPSGDVFLASRAVLATQCPDLIPALYNREGVCHIHYPPSFSLSHFLTFFPPFL